MDDHAHESHYQKLVPFFIFALALFLFFKIVQPMIIILVTSVLLTYVSYPLYKRLREKIPNKSLSIALTLLIAVIIILIPLSLLAFEVTQQGLQFVNSISGNNKPGTLLGLDCRSSDSKICLLIKQAESFSAVQLSKFGLDKQIQRLLPLIIEKITGHLLAIPLMFAGIGPIVLISYFIFKDWENILKKTVNLIPLGEDITKTLLQRFENIAHTVIFAQILVGAVQGIVATIGYYIFGVPFPIILGLLTSFGAMIPTFGTTLVWMPASLYLVLIGYFSHNYAILAKGIGLFAYGLFIISTIDNILMAKIVQAKAKVSPIIALVGVIGGGALFGVVGIFIGPILLPLLITYFEIFKEKYGKS